MLFKAVCGEVYYRVEILQIEFVLIERVRLVHVGPHFLLNPGRFR